MKQEDLFFVGNDPGAVKYGNFINYYKFHSATERMKKFRPAMFPGTFRRTLICLDIGCNTGELTIGFYNYLKLKYPENSVKILGIDIDPLLIDRATEHNDIEDLTFISGDITTQEGQNYILKHLEKNGRNCFDITFCFSVTMWIHINNGDEGLCKFIQFVKDVSDTVIVESQPWKCYRSAQRRIKRQGKDFPLYQSLKIKGDVNSYIEKLFTETTHTKVHESENSSWDRRIQSFFKN